MSAHPPTSNGNHSPDEELNENYEPGDTLNRGMAIACSLVLLAFAVLSCGFVYSVLTLHAHH